MEIWSSVKTTHLAVHTMLYNAKKLVESLQRYILAFLHKHWFLTKKDISLMGVHAKSTQSQVPKNLVWQEFTRIFLQTILFAALDLRPFQNHFPFWKSERHFYRRGREKTSILVLPPDIIIKWLNLPFMQFCHESSYRAASDHIICKLDTCGSVVVVYCLE